MCGSEQAREREDGDHFVESSPLHCDKVISRHTQIHGKTKNKQFFCCFSHWMLYLEYSCYAFDVVGSLNMLTLK